MAIGSVNGDNSDSERLRNVNQSPDELTTTMTDG